MEEKEILLKVEVDRAQAQKELESTTRQLIDSKAALTELNKSFKEGKVSTDQYVRESLRLKGEQKALTDQQRQLTKEIQAEAGSLDQLRLKLASLTRERNSTNQSTEEGAKAARELTEQIKSTSEAIKEQEEAGGDFRRNVGDYKNKFEEAAGSIKVFGVGLDGIGKMIMANPILLLVSALTSLIAIFAKTQTGMEFFRKAGAAVNIVFAKFSDVVEKVFGNLIDIASGTKDFGEALKELGDFILQNIINRFKSVLVLGDAIALLFEGKFKEAAKKAADAAIQVATGVTDATSKLSDLAIEIDKAATAATKLETRLIANEKAEANLAVTRAKSRAEIEKLKFAAEDTSKSLEERAAAAKKAFDIENTSLAQSIKLQRDKINILKEQNNLANSTEEDLQRVRDAEIELANLQVESFTKQTELNNKINAFEKERQQGIDETTNKKKEAIEKEKEAEFNLEEFRKEQAAKNAKTIDERLKKELELEDFRVTELLGKESLLASERTLITEQGEAKKKEIRDRAAKEQIELAKKTADQEQRIKELQINSTLNVTQSGLEAAQLLFKENSEAYKTIATIQATIDTYQSATAAYKSVVGVPYVGPVLAVAAAGAAVAAGLANIQAINAAAGGGDFVTTKPTLLLVGDNPGGRERVTVEPLSGKGKTTIHPGSGMIAMAGGGTLTTGPTFTQSMTSQANSDAVNSSILASLQTMPAPIVSVKEITKRSDRVSVKETIKNL